MDNLYSSFYLYKKYEIIGDELIDLGITSIDADGTQEPVMKEECDPACGCPVEPIYRWVQTEVTVCVGEEPASPKFTLTLSNSSTVSAACDSTSAISQNEISAYSATVVSAEIGSCVTRIGQQAFYGCSGLTSITIPSGVTTISWGAFSYCTALTSVTIPDSVTNIEMAAFSTCSGLTNVTIGTGVTTISSLAFGWCTSLTSITVNATTPPTLGNSAFENTNDCPIYVPCESVSAYQAATNWSDYASRIEGIPPCGQPTPTIDGKFKLTLSDSSTVTAECDSSSAITINEISAYSASVTSVVIGDCVTAIGDNIWSHGPFSGCTGLTSVTIPNSVTIIGDSAFKNCYSLSSITIPNTVTSISGSAFGGCSSLTSATIPDSVTYIGNAVFSFCGISTATIGSGITNISTYLFEGCTSLTSITIPNNVTSIGNSAFSGCTALTSVTIPNSITSIGFNAFNRCSGITSITIPDSVTNIDGQAFARCSGLTSVTCLATTPPTMGNAVFSNTNDCPIYVPCESVSAYQAAEGWSDYASRIQALPTPGDSTGKYTYYYGHRKEKAFCNEISAITGNHSSSTANKLEIGNCVTSIGAGVFSGLTVATSITISSTITSIGDNAFKDCPQMSIIIVNGTTPPTLGNNVFDGTNNCPIQVPCGYASTYRAASGWSAYASRII